MGQGPTQRQERSSLTQSLFLADDLLASYDCGKNYTIASDVYV